MHNSFLNYLEQLGGAALGQKVKISVAQPRKSAPKVVGKISELGKTFFTSSKELVEYLMEAVPDTVREHVKFDEMMTKIKDDVNEFENLRGMSKDAAVKYITSQVMATMRADFKEIVERRKKMQKKKAEFDKMVSNVNASDKERKDARARLKALRKMMKEDDALYADITKGIKSISTQTKDADFIQSLEKVEEDKDKYALLDEPVPMPVKKSPKKKKNDLDSSVEKILSQYSIENQRKAKKDLESYLKNVREAKTQSEAEKARAALVNRIKSFNSSLHGNSKKPRNDELQKMLKKIPKDVVVQEEEEEEEEIVVKKEPVVEKKETVVKSENQRIIDEFDDEFDYSPDDDDIPPEAYDVQPTETHSPLPFEEEEEDDDESVLHLKINGGGAKYLRKNKKTKKSHIKKL